MVALMRLSLVIPAYNEEKYLTETLEAVKFALARISEHEVIIVDNQSTDATRDIAESFGAKIMDEVERNIAKVRNTGGFAADGEVIVFLDADTLVVPGVFEKINEAMSDKRCVGGSVAVEYEAPRNRQLFMRWFMRLWTVLGRLTKMRQGALQFCRSDIFGELGGYDITIYVGEDIEFHLAAGQACKKTRGLHRLCRGTKGPNFVTPLGENGTGANAFLYPSDHYFSNVASAADVEGLV